MFIVDAQVHLWAADTPERPWPKAAGPHGPVTHRPVPLGVDEMLLEMDAAGVARVVIVPPLWEGRRNDLATAAAEAHPNRFAVMGRLDPAAPTSRGRLATWRNQPGMLGLRFALHTPVLSPLLTEGHMDWVWAEAERAGVPIYVLVPHALVPLIDDVAQRHPGLRIVMDHFALAGNAKDAEAFRDFDKLLAIAKRPNVAAKASALPCFSTDSYPYRSLHPYIRRAYDAFGPRRLFWGTDLSRSPITYRENVTIFVDEMPWLGGDDKEWIMGRGVCDWLGWPMTG
jgi:predicted TIM-barrel fold metal-dependent hydrolase